MADGLPVHSHAKSMGSIVEEHEIVTAGDFRQFFEPAGISIDMHCQNGGGPRRDRFFHLFRIQRVMVRLNIHKNRPNLVPVKGMGGGYKSEWGRDYFAGQPHALQGDLECQCPVVKQAEVFRVKMAAKLALIALHDRAVVGKPPVGPDFFQP